MKKISKLICFLLAAAMLLSGCVMRTVDELYYLPKRPQADSDLQEVIDQAMTGLAYSAPVYGDNRQVLQTADLDGDGQNEYVVLARESSQKSLKLLIFCQQEGSYLLTDTIEGYGTAFDFIEFANIDGQAGMEIIVGRQVGDGSVRSAVIYALSDGKAEQLLEVSYTKFLASDMDGDGNSELMVLHPGESASMGTSVSLYCLKNGKLTRTSTQEISDVMATVQQMEAITLTDGVSAVLLTAREGDSQSMEIFAYLDGQLKHAYGPVEIGKLNSYFVYATDADCDGELELPELVDICTADGQSTGEYWIVWYSVSSTGKRGSGMYTYYSYADKWYLHIDRLWADKLTVTRSEGMCTFSDMDEQIVMTIYTLSGTNRQEQAQQLGGVVLASSQSVIFVAVTGPGAQSLGITEQTLKQMFYPIELELYTEEG